MANAVVGRVLLIPKGNYSASVSYNMLDLVRYDNKSWVCKQTCTGQTPQGGDYWQLMASDGADGTNSYIYIRYSANADGSDFVSAPTEQTKYVGFYTGDSETAPTNKTSYAWSKYVGEDGTDGEDGTNTYTYIRYSASADGTGFVDTPTNLTSYIGFYTGTSATAPTDKTAYAWSKYVGESGSGTGDMLKSVYAQNGSTGVVDTSNRLRKYATTSSGATYANQWTKIATLTFTAAYQNENVIFSVINPEGPYGMGIFSARVVVGTTASTHSEAAIKCFSADKKFKSSVRDIKIVYNAPVYELWFNPAGAHSQLHISVLNEKYRGVGFTWLENQPYQATQPSGTVVTATLMEDYLITDLTAETAIADADYFMMHDTSAVANRKTLWSNIKSVLKAYFDTFYNNYVLPKATTSTLGGIKPDGTTITVDENGVASSAGASGTILDSGTAIKNNTTADQIAGGLGVKALFNEINSNLGDIKSIDADYDNVKEILDYLLSSGQIFLHVFVALIPQMTSATTPNGISSGSTNTDTNDTHWKAFNGTLTNTDDCWLAYFVNAPADTWLQYEFPATKTVSKIVMTNRSGSTANPPKDFLLQGSNDGNAFSDIQQFENLSTLSSAESEYDVQNGTAYKIYRLKVITSYDATYADIGKLQLWGY